MRSSHRRCFIKKAVLKNFAIFTGKLLFKKRLEHWCFPLNIAKFLRTPILKNICYWFFKTDTEHRWAAASVWTLLLSSDGLLTGYEQLRPQSTLSNKIELCLKTWLCYYIHFFNIYLNVLRPTFFNICNLPFLSSPNIGKIRVKVGPKTNYFSYFMSSCTNRIAVFNNFFSLICSEPRDKQNRARGFFPFEYFLNNQLLTIFMETTLSKLVELLL